jgi:copper homeostasis protein (lipoprotein)
MTSVMIGVGCVPASQADGNIGTEVDRRRAEQPDGGLGKQTSDFFGTLPASFEGELPCADCPGIYYHLDLFEDRVFFLRMTYLGRGAGAVHDVVGSWALDREGGSITLVGGSEGPIFFRIVDAHTIRKLDIEGRDIESSLNYDLKRKEGLVPIEPRLEMRGMYRYMADAALFEECLSGRRFLVAREADNAALERAYLEARPEPGEPLLVSIQGRIAERPAVEGDAMVLTVVPERFLGVWPGETCGARVPQAELEDTYWKLTRIGGEPVLAIDRRREPRLVLRSEDRRMNGYGGCNRLMGEYSLDGDSIRFSQIGTTKMACVEGDETELALLAALERARRWRLIGRHLDLLDDAGNLLARFEARDVE